VIGCGRQRQFRPRHIPTKMNLTEQKDRIMRQAASCRAQAHEFLRQSEMVTQKSEKERAEALEAFHAMTREGNRLFKVAMGEECDPA
jgi:hypothetical protein